ncbi:S-layer homology domain-containing protein [Paenibacillus sp. TRM 82003]|nr:S-layer homology domain-containing protein [Paenibacillus sp. TRM 82003]
MLGVYYIADDGTLEYAGGTLENGEMVAEVSHFSTYAVLEYDKTFADVGREHWAYDIVKEMAAKHIVTGVSDTEFAPERAVTRAEFAALLVRALGLAAQGEALFADVDAAAWYADDIAAAYEAGLVRGRDAATFAPDEKITRQEMAAMIVKAYELRAGFDAASEPAVAFADGDAIDAWAEDAVQAAQALGFVQGRGHGVFAPQDVANRAESAKVVLLLLKK